MRFSGPRVTQTRQAGGDTGVSLSFSPTRRVRRVYEITPFDF